MNKSIQRFLIYIVILVGTGGLGFFDRLFSIETPAGVLTESLIILPTLFLLNLNKIIFKIKHRDIVVFFYTFFLVLLLFKVFQNILIDNLPIGFILTQMRPFLGLFLVYLIILNFNKKKELYSLIKYLILLASISSLLTIYQYFSGNFIESKFVYVSQIENVTRIFNRSIWLIALMLILSLISLGVTKLLPKRKTLFLIFLYTITILITMTRSVILAVLIIMFVISLFILFNSKRPILKMVKFFTLFFISITFIYFTLSNFGYKFDTIINRFSDGFLAVKDPNYDDGSQNLRMIMIGNQFVNVINDSPITGKGLNINIVEIEGRVNYFEKFARNEDATYQNVMIYFGFSGLITLFVLFFSYFKTGLKVFRQKSDRLTETIGLFVFVLPFFFIPIGLYGDYFSFNGFVTFSIFSGIIYTLKYYEE